jgi:hypothetical protein
LDEAAAGDRCRPVFARIDHIGVFLAGSGFGPNMARAGHCRDGTDAQNPNQAFLMANMTLPRRNT